MQSANQASALIESTVVTAVPLDTRPADVPSALGTPGQSASVTVVPPIDITLTCDLTPRRILDEEDDLSEVQPDAVPTEVNHITWPLACARITHPFIYSRSNLSLIAKVREWLATTFTRNSTAQKRRSEDKPKFRSVANAIRAGILVDRLYRRLCGPTVMMIPSNIAEKLKVIVAPLSFFF